MSRAFCKKNAFFYQNKIYFFKNRAKRGSCQKKSTKNAKKEETKLQSCIFENAPRRLPKFRKINIYNIIKRAAERAFIMPDRCVSPYEGIHFANLQNGGSAKPLLLALAPACLKGDFGASKRHIQEGDARAFWRSIAQKRARISTRAPQFRQ
jgi:hypothetical protein